MWGEYMKFKKYMNDQLDCILFELENLDEGVYDPSIFKAIFMAGGPGSGKSFVAKNVTGGHGLKMVNSDTMLELLMKKAGLSLDMTQMTPEQEAEKEEIRVKAKGLTDKQKASFVKGRLGMVIDGTGRDYKKIKGQRDTLEQLGYDTYMVFVNTSLDVALERNLERPRKVKENIVKNSWKSVQDNMGKFQSLFGKKNFKIVDNNVFVSDLKVFDMAWKDAMKFARSPVQNRTAQKWIEAQLKAKKK